MPKLTWPAPERNKAPIQAALSRWVPASGRVLEIASGSGQHAAHFAACWPGLDWQPTDLDPAHLDSIAAWRSEAGLPNLLPPLRLDVLAEDWGIAPVEVVFCANMIHIAPWACTGGLMRGAARVLRPGGVVALYGPFRVGGAHTAPSNEAFDADLRARNPLWGVRDLEAVRAEADAVGLRWVAREELPANNQLVVWEKRGG